MGVGNKKTAIVKAVSNNVFCGIRLGGMGVAIGSTIGNELEASLTSKLKTKRKLLFNSFLCTFRGGLEPARTLLFIGF